MGTRTQNTAFLGRRALVWSAMPSIEGNIDNVMLKNFVIRSGICHHSTETIITTVTSLPHRSDGFYGSGGNNVIRIVGKNHLLYKRFLRLPIKGFFLSIFILEFHLYWVR